MPNLRKDQEISMLRSEIEMLMSERRTLLIVTGAAAVFVANMDSKSLPQETYESAEMLAEGLNALPEDTLRDALDVVKAREASKDTKK
jgi:predicted nucleotidyltransferase component of viral defense system